MIVLEDDLSSLRHELDNKTIVFTSGTFDLIHPGHLEFLGWCKSQGDVLVVAVNNDEHTRLVKGKNRPVLNEVDRLNMVDSLKAVDYVIMKKTINTEKGIPAIFIASKLRPNIAVLGYDWADREIQDWRVALPATEVLVAPQRSPGRSTSHIIHSIIKAYSDD